MDYEQQKKDRENKTTTPTPIIYMFTENSTFSVNRSPGELSTLCSEIMSAWDKMGADDEYNMIKTN